MQRSNAAAFLIVAIVVIVGVLGLRYRPALRSAESPVASAAQAVREPAYPPANVDGRIETEATGRTVELCGYGPFEIAPDRLWPVHLSAAADRALAQASAALAETGTPRQRAGARYLRTPRELLVADALSTRDPAAHALAFYACLKQGPDKVAGGSCALVSAAQWAQLEPNNVMAWVHAAWEAHVRGDAAGRADAVRRAAQATESRLHMDAVFEPLGHPAIRNLDAVTRSIAQTTAIGIHAAIPLPGLLVLNGECLSKPPLDDARRELCSALGRTLAERGESLFEMAYGVRIGERVGWPEAELQVLRQRRDAIQQVMFEEHDTWSCAYQQHSDRFTAAVLTGKGEVQVGERLVRSSGRSPTELALAWRARSVPQPPAPK